MVVDHPQHRASTVAWTHPLSLSLVLVLCSAQPPSFTDQRLLGKTCWKARWGGDVPPLGVLLLLFCIVFASRRIPGLEYSCPGQQFPRFGHISPNFKWKHPISKEKAVWMIKIRIRQAHRNEIFLFSLCSIQRINKMCICMKDAAL